MAACVTLLALLTAVGPALTAANGSTAAVVALTTQLRDASLKVQTRLHSREALTLFA